MDGSCPGLQALEMKIDTPLFIIKDTQWDHDHACRIELKDEVSQLPRVDYRRQPMHLLQIAVRIVHEGTAILDCR